MTVKNSNLNYWVIILLAIGAIIYLAGVEKTSAKYDELDANASAVNKTQPKSESDENSNDRVGQEIEDINTGTSKPSDKVDY